MSKHVPSDDKLDFRLITEVNNPLIHGTPPKVLDIDKPVRWEIFNARGEPFYIEVDVRQADDDGLQLRVRSSGIYPFGALRVLPVSANCITVTAERED